MEKEKTYRNAWFDAEVVRQAGAIFVEKNAASNRALSKQVCIVQHDEERWTYDDAEEFFAAYRRQRSTSKVVLICASYSLSIHFFELNTYVSVSGDTRAEIESVFNVFERNLARSIIPSAPSSQPIVFIGHGRSSAWKDLKDHLQDKHEFKIEAYETGARAGHTIRDILEDMAKKSTFALLVLTAEDEQIDGTLRARENVVHECGLFQGKLGFSRAIMLVEEGVEPFSNVAGIQFIRFSKGNIKEVFGEVLATLKREFG